MIRKLILPCCLAILVVALTGCGARNQSAAQTPSAAPTIILPIVTETSASLPASAAPTRTAPAPTPTLAPVSTSTPLTTDILETPAAVTPLPVINPTPAGPPIAPIQAGTAITITTIRMLDATNGWAVGGQAQDSDHVLSTADGGQTWLDVTPPEPVLSGTSQAAIGFFVDVNTAWVTYYPQKGLNVPPEARVWRTQDGGQTWQSSAPLDLQGLNEFYLASDLVFADLQNGWLLVHVGVGMSHDYVALYRTMDGGQTWARLIDPYGVSGIQGCQKTGLVFTTAQAGWLTGDCNGVEAGAFLFQTADGGQTWQPVTLPVPADAPDLFSDPGPACGTRSAIFFSPQVGKLIVTCSDYARDPAVLSDYLYTTLDGGSSWTAVSCPADSVLFLSPDIGWALGRDVFHTSDGGQTWTAVKTVHWDGQFSFVSDSLGWAVARAAGNTGTLIALVQTRDGAQSWVEIHPVIAP
jgi:photosystem II stability/assembly factor-like uncharacterized protein